MAEGEGPGAAAASPPDLGEVGGARDQWHFWGPARLARALRAGEVTAEALARSFLERQRAWDAESGINAVVVPIEVAEVLARAREADELLASDGLAGASDRPLLGVPYTLKESYDVKGMRSVWGCPAEAGAPERTHSSEVHRKLEAAGAILVGKTNTPPLLADWQSYNKVFGTTGNPFDPTHTAGGSSGGSAAAVAAGFSAFDIGSDIGGSIRVPASFCGIWGHKPTFGIISPEGHNLRGWKGPGSDMAVQGPLATSAEDLRLLLRILSGPHSLERKGLRVDLPESREMGAFRDGVYDKLAGGGGHDVRPFKVAIWAEEPGFAVSSSVTRTMSRVTEHMKENLKMECFRVTYEDILPLFRTAMKDEGTALREELGSTAGVLRFYERMLRMQLFARMPPEAFEKLVADARELEPSDRSPRAETLRDATRYFWHAALDFETRAHLRLGFEGFFRNFDVMIMPGTPVTAFSHSLPRDQGPDASPHLWDPLRSVKVDGKDCPYFPTMAFWQMWANLALLPSTAFPVGCDEDGLPIGLQVMGAAYEDNTTISFAELLSESLQAQVFGGERIMPAPPPFSH